MKRRDKSGGAVLDSGPEASAAEFDGEEGLEAGRLVHLPTKDEGERRELKVVKVVVGGEKVGRIAGAETVGKFREREAVSEKAKLNLGVVEGRKEIKDLIDFPDAPVDDVLRVGDVADGAAEKNEAAVGGTRDTTIQGIGDVDSRWQCISITAPNKGFLGVDVKANLWPSRLEEVEGKLEVSAIPDERDIIEKGDVKEESGAFFFEKE